ncbi:hypothetical protein ACLBWZ_14725 [Brucellaceae bacterium C25G]
MQNSDIDASWLSPIDIETKNTWLRTTRPRLGFVPTKKLFTYITVGVAYGGVKANLSGANSGRATQHPKASLAAL